MSLLSVVHTMVTRIFSSKHYYILFVVYEFHVAERLPSGDSAHRVPASSGRNKTFETHKSPAYDVTIV